MAPKQKITKEMILETAYEITRELGIDAVNSRGVAKRLGCSTQPVFSQFATIEELKKGTFEYVCRHSMQEILAEKGKEDFMVRTSMWVIHLARKEPKLFHLLYLSDSFESVNLLEVMLSYESNRELLAKLAEVYGLEEGECRDILVRSFLFMHGIATMIATNHMDFSDEEAAKMMRQTVGDMVEGIKRRKQEEKV